MAKFKEFIKESPDRVSTRIWHGTRDARTFGYINGKFFVSEQPINHGLYVEKLLNSGKINLKDLGVDSNKVTDLEIGRHTFKFPGRLWLNSKIISFWSFPNKAEFSKIVSELNKHGIKIDDTWKIDTDTKDVDLWGSDDTDQTKLIKVSDYTDKMKNIKVKDVEHTLSPELKNIVLKNKGVTPKTTNLPSGFTMAKYNFLTKQESLEEDLPTTVAPSSLSTGQIEKKVGSVAKRTTEKEKLKKKIKKKVDEALSESMSHTDKVLKALMKKAESEGMKYIGQMKWKKGDKTYTYSESKKSFIECH